MRRIVYASSVHAIGYHELEAQIDAKAPHRPDSLYGLSKCFVEDLGRLYWDKFGIRECAPAHLLVLPGAGGTAHALVVAVVRQLRPVDDGGAHGKQVGHTIAFGMSDNKLKPVDNRLSGHLGFHPKNSAEPFRAAVEAAKPQQDPRAPATRYLGGWFIDLGHPDDETTK